MPETVFLTFLCSLFAFYAADLSTWVYLLAVTGSAAFLSARYAYRKNLIFYRKTGIIFSINFLTFIIVKWIHGYRLLFDLEDRICIFYGIVLAVNLGVLHILIRKEERDGKTEKEKVLFRERKFDLSRLEEYLEEFPMLGVNGAWGTGKSFLTDQLAERGYLLVKIDLLSCNLDEIQVVLLNELDKLLREHHIFSAYSPKLKKILKHSGGLMQNIGQFLVRDDVAYSEAIAGFRHDLKCLNQKILILYEDLDRVDDTKVIKKVLGISEKIAGKNVKIIYQFDESLLLRKEGIDSDYLEKYIPFTVNLTEIPFYQALRYLFEERGEQNLPIEQKDFEFLILPVMPHFSVLGNSSVQFQIDIPDVTIRKVDYFLDEIFVFMKKEDGIYRNHKRETILFFLLKRFYPEIYQKLVPGESLLETFMFSWKDGECSRKDTILNWQRYCKQNRQNFADIFLAQENRESALILSLFQYRVDIYEMEHQLEEMVNEPVKNLQEKNENEQKDRIVWNLLCSGKSEYTDQERIIKRMCREVLQKSPKEQIGAFNDLWEEVYHGRYAEDEKNDNQTIFRLGVPSMVSLFQAARMAGMTEEQWIAFIRFYIHYRKLQSITSECIACLNYCDLKGRETYFYILREFNRLEVKRNLNVHKSYRTFLDNYLSALSLLGYIDTEEVWGIRNGDESGELDPEFVISYVMKPLKEKLCLLQQKIPFPQITEDINILKKFLDKNEELMRAAQKFEKPQIKFDSEIRSTMQNEDTFNRLNAVREEDSEFTKTVEDAYRNREITAYEIARLDRLKNDDEK